MAFSGQGAAAGAAAGASFGPWGAAIGGVLGGFGGGGSGEESVSSYAKSGVDVYRVDNTHEPSYSKPWIDLEEPLQVAALVGIGLAVWWVWKKGK